MRPTRQIWVRGRLRRPFWIRFKNFHILELSWKFYFWNIFVSSECNQWNSNICIYFVMKFYFLFRSFKIFEIRPRKFLFTGISWECVGGNFFSQKIRTQRKISRRIRYNDMGSLFVIVVFPINASFSRLRILIEILKTLCKQL